MTKLVLVVAAALINEEGEILLAQRPEGKAMEGLWEFPGGKIEPGETPELALKRELKEELGVEIDEKALKPINFASFGYESFHLLMPLYSLRKWSGEIQPVEGQAFAWVAPADLHKYPAPEADIPLFDFFNRKGMEL